MKIAFDEHVPLALVRAFQSFANERQLRKLTGGLTIEKAKDYAPKPSDADYLKGNDVPWIKRYSNAGGQIIISGDTDMMREPHERLALIEEGMIVVFFTGRWGNWKFFRQCALLLCWWPKIVKAVKTAEKGTFWRIPPHFSEDGEIEQISMVDKKLLKIARQRAAQPAIAEKRKAARNTNQRSQGELTFTPSRHADGK